MTKAHLIDRLAERVAERTPELSRKQVEQVVNTIFTAIRDSLKKGEKTEIRGFGSFRLRTRQTKEGRNPKTGATVCVPEKRMPFFKAGKEIKELLNQCSNKEGTSHESA
ncbi:MAG: integration host factor subunit beta [Nitrospirae bacterium]|nr:MAG: integration host factor subunit beta [Nitrospirota bacterium]